MLVACGVATTGITGAQAQNSDERPYPWTAENHGITLTAHDCSRVTIESNRTTDPDEIEVHVRYRDEDGPTATDLHAYDPTYPHEFVANCVLDDIGAAPGTSAGVSRVRVKYQGRQIVSWLIPQDGCAELINQPVDQFVLEEHC